MDNSLSNLTQQFEEVIIKLSEELKVIRTDRASPSLVEKLTVEAYGTKTPLIELASITAPEPTLLVIQPWDKNIIKEIEKSLQTSSLGLNPQNEGTIIRLRIPPLTEERREELKRLIQQKLEVAKITIKNFREKVLKESKEKKQKGEISEDIFFSQQKELQQIIDDCHVKISKVGQEKIESLK